MATRFGGARSAQAANVRRNWIFVLFGCIAIVLFSAIVVLSRSNEDPAGQAGANPATLVPQNPASSDSTEQLLVAIQRIEEGSQLSPTMFQEEKVSRERIPSGAFKANNKAALLGLYSKRLIVPSIPLTSDDVTDKPPVGLPGLIPPGYRAVTIEVNQTSSVEGFTRPNTRVDVLYSFTDRDRQRKVTTLIRFAKILSFGGQTAATGRGNEGQPGNTVTLLVTELDAQRIELARTTGALSLVLVGDTEPHTQPRDSVVVGQDRLLGGGNALEVKAKPPITGKMYIKDDKTGEKIMYCLRSGELTLDCAE